MGYKLFYTVFCFLLFVISPYSLDAQYSKMRFNYLTPDDGLYSDHIYAFCRDYKGCIWIGTVDFGLNKWDGNKISGYRYKKGEKGSLSHDGISCIFEDSKKNLWVGTFNGLNLYNRNEESFTVFLNDSDDIISENNTINAIFEDRKGNIWIATGDGLKKWIKEENRFLTYHIQSKDYSAKRIMSVVEDSNGSLWVATYARGIYKFDPKKESFTVYDDPTIDFGNIDPLKDLCIDKHDNLWIACNSGGLISFTPSTCKFEQYGAKGDHKGTNSKLLRKIIEEDDRYMLIATDHGGINRFDRINRTFEYITYEENKENGLNSNGLWTIYKDPEGILWVGTSSGGVNYYNPKKDLFKTFRHNSGNPGSLCYNAVLSMFEDSEGLIWIGTNGGGLSIFDPKTERFKNYKHDPANPNSLGSNVILSITEDKEHNIWLGTWGNGLNCYNKKTGKFIHYVHNENDKTSLKTNIVWYILPDQNGNIWVSIPDGIDIFDKNKGVIKEFRPDSKNKHALSHHTINAIYKDYDQNIWICTQNGINLYDAKSNSFIVFKNFPDNSIISFLKDKEGCFWVGSNKKGLYHFKLDGTIIDTFRFSQGEYDSKVSGILEDNKFNLWLSTDDGLIKFNKKNKSFKRYSTSDGLQGRLFSMGLLKSHTGQMYFGGYNGFSTFHADSLKKDNDYIPVISLTDFQIFNKPVSIGAEGSPLKKSISETEEITLSYRQSTFSFEFTAISLTHPEKQLYAYKMEGYEKEWNYTTADRRYVTYTNLDAGSYIFRVKGSNNDGVWNQTGISLKINILPPWWRTWWAYSLYLLVFVAIIYFVVKYILTQNQLALARMEANKLHEIDQLKLNVFTNISHEFRTPLTLIMGPLEKFIKDENASGLDKSLLNLMYRNSQRLMRLINQLLDFRKLEAGQLKLNLTHDDIIIFIVNIAETFKQYAEKRNIKYQIVHEVESLQNLFDPDKLDKILYNLLSNAFNYTPDNGEITIAVETINDGITDFVEIKVKDNGIGIPKEALSSVFNIFYQVEGNAPIKAEGTGIGLSLVKELVNLHNGHIYVESEVGKGSIFTVQIPLNIKQQPTSPQAITKAGNIFITSKLSSESIKADENLNNSNENRGDDDTNIVLIIEDNDDLREYLEIELSPFYRVIKAKDGLGGMNEAIENIPDIIISDIMMPGIDGIELCNRLKANAHTCHIPIILLTARQSLEHKIEGIESGADDYITKPFSAQFLLARIKNLIFSRQRLKDYFNKTIITSDTIEFKVNKSDENFINRTQQTIENNYHKPDFDIEEFASLMNMSSRQLFRKIKALTNQTPNALIVNCRMRHASELLIEGSATVYEIAYATGFTDPSYFTKVFVNQFGIIPSSYKEKHDNK